MLNRKRNSRRSAPSSRRLQLPALNWRRIGLSLAAVAVIALALTSLGWLLNEPIQRVVVSGRLQRVSALDVERIVRTHLAGAGLVSVDLDDISRGLRTLPWVDEAAVQRNWPRALKIQIIEQTAVARWNDTGLLNTRGELFMSEARFVPPELPLLSGPDGSQAEVTARYLAAQGRLTEVGMRMVAMALDARGAWSITLDDGVVVRLGRAQIDQRFERFMMAAAKLVSQRAADIAYVDMRYSNGFAIGWKGGAGRAAAGAQPVNLNG
jgi:cell division protein FtsQ